jgi:hypothetical protein
MRITEKLDLIDRLGRELQQRYTFVEIDAFLRELGIEPPAVISSNSKWVYSKEALSGQPESLLLRVASELELTVSPNGPPIVEPPANWKESSQFKLFISHISKDKQVATRLREALAPFSISGFVAHDDIHPSLEWQGQIERALRHMDAMIAVHTEGFAQSCWTQQEVGFALGQGTYVISFKWGEDPTGFISKHQALPRRNRNADQIAEEIDRLLSLDPRTKDRLAAAKPTISAFGEPDDGLPF